MNSSFSGSLSLVACIALVVTQVACTRWHAISPAQLAENNAPCSTELRASVGQEADTRTRNAVPCRHAVRIDIRGEEQLRIDTPVAVALASDTMHVQGPRLDVRAISLENVQQVEERHFNPLATFFLVMGLSLAVGAVVGTPILLAN